MLAIIPLFIGTTELILIAGVALLIFGGKKIPEVMRGMGAGVKSFKDGMREGVGETKDNDSIDTENEKRTNG